MDTPPSLLFPNIPATLSHHPLLPFQAKSKMTGERQELGEPRGTHECVTQPPSFSHPSAVVLLGKDRDARALPADAASSGDGCVPGLGTIINNYQTVVARRHKKGTLLVIQTHMLSPLRLLAWHLAPLSSRFCCFAAVS